MMSRQSTSFLESLDLLFAQVDEAASTKTVLPDMVNADVPTGDLEEYLEDSLKEIMGKCRALRVPCIALGAYLGAVRQQTADCQGSGSTLRVERSRLGESCCRRRPGNLSFCSALSAGRSRGRWGRRQFNRHPRAASGMSFCQSADV